MNWLTGLTKIVSNRREGIFSLVFVALVFCLASRTPFESNTAFPKRVYAENRYYNIYLAEPKCDKDDPRKTDCYDGMTYFCNEKLQPCRIEISPRSDVDRKETLMHELEHVAIRCHGLAYDETQTFTEDDFIESNAPQLLEILSDPRNAEIRKYLFQEGS